MSDITALTSASFEQAINATNPTLVDFWAPWCGPCKAIAPILEEIAEERQALDVCKIDIDSNHDIALKYNVATIPTLIFFRNGKEIGRTMGVQSKADILSKIDDALASDDL